MKMKMTKVAEKLVKKVASITADSGSFLYCYQPKEPKSLQEKKKVKSSVRECGRLIINHYKQFTIAKS